MLINKPRKSVSLQITEKLYTDINSTLTPKVNGINQPNTFSSNINDTYLYNFPRGVNKANSKQSKTRVHSSLSAILEMVQKEKLASRHSRPKSSLQVIRNLGLPKLVRKKSLFCSANSSENSTPNVSFSKFKHSSKVITKFIPPNSPDSNSFTDDNSVLSIKLEKIKKTYHDKPFGKFCGFTAFTFKNRETYNCDELDICINIDANVNDNKKTNNSSSQVHLLAIHHGTNGQDVSALLRKRLKYYLFKNIKYINNPLQSISDVY